MQIKDQTVANTCGRFSRALTDIQIINNYIVDFKASYAQPGIYPFCVDIYGYQNEYLESLQRHSHLHLTSLTLGNFVWNDINYNGIQDSGEPGIKDVKVELYNSDNVLGKP